MSRIQKCPHCQTALNVGTTFPAGLDVICPACKKPFRPAPPAAAPPHPAPSPPRSARGHGVSPVPAKEVLDAEEVPEAEEVLEAVPVRRARPRSAHAARPVEPERPEAPSLFYRICVSGAVGLLLPVLGVFVFAIDLGLSALLDEKNPSARNSLTANLFTGTAGLRMLLVILAAFSFLGLGILAGNAVAGGVGIFIGAVSGYVLGSVGGGVACELLQGPRKE